MPRKSAAKKSTATKPGTAKAIWHAPKIRELEPTEVGVYLTTDEAAAYLKLSKPFLEGARYRGDGTGPRFIKLVRSVRYKKSALDAWMDAHDHAADVPLRA